MLKRLFTLLTLTIPIACNSNHTSDTTPGAGKEYTSENQTKKNGKKGASSSPGNNLPPEIDPSIFDEPGPVDSPEEKGPYPVKSYTEGLDDSAYSSAIIYYPASEPKNGRKTFPATTLSGGYGNTKEQMVWIAEHLASHGIIVQIFTPTTAMSTDPTIWSTGHLGSIKKMKSEAENDSSPINGLVDTESMGIMGFSMGGAGTILASNANDKSVKAAIALCPYQPKPLTSGVSMLFVTGTADVVAVPANVEKAYNSSESDAPKALLNLTGMTHQGITGNGSYKRQLSRYLTTWYKVYLSSNLGYHTYLAGEEAEKDKAGGGITTFNYSGN